MASSSSYKPSYTPLSDRTNSGGAPANHRRSIKFVSCTLLSILCVVLSVLVVRNHSPLQKSELVNDETPQQSVKADGDAIPSREEAAGDGVLESWTNRMLSWQRTAFHFQPPKSWMNGNLLI